METETATAETAEGPQVYEGDERGLQEAAAELARRREEAAFQRPEAPEEPPAPDAGDIKLYYTDPAKASEPKTVRQAADMYGEYRRAMEAQALADMQAEFDAQQQTTTEQTPPEQSPAAEKSYEEQWKEYYEGLTPEGKAQVQAAAQYHEQTAQLQQAALTHELALIDLLGQVQGATNKEFADIRTPQDIHNLKQMNPARFALLEQRMQAAQAVTNEAMKVQNARAQQEQKLYQEQHAAYAKAEDDKVGRLVPELADEAPKHVQREFQRAALNTLKSAGFSDQELDRGWRQGQPFLLRDSRVQLLISKAAKWDMAEKSRSELRDQRVREAPKMLRPGLSRGVHEGRADFADRAMEKLARSNKVEDAVQALRARRAAGRG